jgi:chromosome segregation ATPase
MIIRKLIVRGDSYQRTLEFSSGLNIIRGEKTSGKSLVLSLIDYCLGKGSSISLKVQTELDDNVDFIFLEIEIAKEIFTISRNIRKGMSTFWVYHSEYNNIDDYIPETFDKKKLQGFLMDKLGAIEFTKTKNKARTNKLTTETISFRDIYRYCFVSQHELGTHNFLSHNEPMKRYKNPICFEMIFDLIDYSQNNLQTEIAKVQNQIEDDKKSKENLEGYLKQRGNSNFIDLLDQIDNLNEQIEKLQKRKNEIVQRQNADQEVTKSNRDYVLLNNEIRELENDIQLCKNQIYDTELGIASNEILLKDYHLEMDDIRTTKEINYKLRINEHELTCPLCNSKIKNNFHEEKIERQSKDNFKSILKDIQSKVSMVEGVIETSKKKVSELKVQIDRKSRKKNILLLALEEFSKDIQTPFLPELNSINVNINNYDKNREILLESKRVFNKIDELTKNIDVEEIKLKKLKDKLKSMEEKGQRKVLIMEELNKNYLKNMKKMKYAEIQGSFIDSKEYIPHYKDASVYEHDSGGLLECMQLSYLNAIITNKESKFHPKVLLLDSISKYFGTNENQEIEEEEKINDPEVYLNIFFMLEELSNKAAQVIVVENTPPSEMIGYVRYTFRSGERGFIDQTKNEFLTE